MHRVLSVCLALAIAAVAGCTWVELEPGAEDVLVLPPERVEDCKRLGRTEVSVADSVWFFDRHDEDVKRDLADLARNNAVEMGGDTISVLGEMTDGKQRYGIYDCVRD